ncbi:MliC family protein [Pandoraea pneumonica]|uniref:MliC family protein n=1 Tax=Pandoraea pneumonica TaxID=2508299 RepID=UPI003CF5D1A2
MLRTSSTSRFSKFSLGTAALTGALLLASAGVQAKTVSYLCENGHVAVVVYDDHNLGGDVTLYWMGKREVLKPTRAASGEKHVGRSLIWWSKGPEGTLYRTKGEQPITQCKE